MTRIQPIACAHRGRKRLPKPATGNTAFLSLAISAPQDFAQLRLIDHRHAEALRLLELGSGLDAGHHIVSLLRHRGSDSPAVPLDRIEKTIDGLYPQPKLLILNYPHNPTAMTIEPAFWDRAIALCKRRGIMIISDFAYGEVNFDGL